MIPLWTTATSSPHMRGCAFVSIGFPCVAQRVWAIPVLPCGRSCATSASSSATFPTVLTRSMRSRITASPAES